MIFINKKGLSKIKIERYLAVLFFIAILFLVNGCSKKDTNETIDNNEVLDSEQNANADLEGQDEPFCDDIGTNNEGWYNLKSGKIYNDNCESCIAVCDKIGSRSEGWYSSCTDQLIIWANCAE